MWMRTLKIGLPFTMKHEPDHTKLWRKDQCAKIEYPKPDGIVIFDRLSSVFLLNTNHEEEHPVHLLLKYPSIPIEHNLPLYDEPAQRYRSEDHTTELHSLMRISNSVFFLHKYNS